MCFSVTVKNAFAEMEFRSRQSAHYVLKNILLIAIENCFTQKYPIFLEINLFTTVVVAEKEIGK